LAQLGTGGLELSVHPHEGLQQSQYRLAQPLVPVICGFVLPEPETPPLPDIPPVLVVLPVPLAPPLADAPPAPALPLPHRPQVKLQ